MKADDAGVALAAGGGPAPVQALGRGLVVGMPVLLKLLGLVGTVAMLWVGGGILLHGLEEYGVTAPGHALHDAAAVPPVCSRRSAGRSAWLVNALGSAVVGLLVGAALIPVVNHGSRRWPPATAGESRGRTRRPGAWHGGPIQPAAPSGAPAVGPPGSRGRNPTSRSASATIGSAIAAARCAPIAQHRVDAARSSSSRCVSAGDRAKLVDQQRPPAPP